jgi:hypothetical protein
VIESLLRPEPLGLPVPAAWLHALKVAGFVLHMIFMNLWLAGMPTALLLGSWKPLVGQRLFKAMPFFMAFGINAGIVPLLFLQTLYPQFFYPATILQAWFWFIIIPLLIIAYYAVYLAAFNRFRIVAAALASILLAWIGLTFSAAMTLTAAPEQWPVIFSATADAGAVRGGFLYLRAESMLRFFMMVGLSFGTLSAYLALDAEFFTADAAYKNEARKLVAPLYFLGCLIFAGAASVYAPAVKESLPPWLWFSAGACMPVGALLSIFYWRQPAKTIARFLIAFQFAALLANALARQIVQNRSLEKWAKLDAMPVRGDWDSFVLFMVVLAVVLSLLGWLARVALRAASTTGPPRYPSA